MAQPQSALRQMPTQSAEPFVRSYNPFNPAFRDTVRSGINELIGGREMGGTPTQRYRAGMADLLSGSVDFVPGIGEAAGVGDVRRELGAGNYGNAAIAGGATMLGVLPIAGDMMAQAGKSALRALRDAPTISAGSRTSLDPNSLFFRESEQNRLEQASELFDSGEEIQPIVTIYNNGRRDILDGHNRASIAISRNQNLPAVDIDIAEYDLLKGAGFDDMEIAYATLLRADEDEAASAINNQFYGSGIRQRGAEALSRMDSPAPASAAPSPLEGRVNVGYDVDAISRNYPQTGPGSLNFSNPKKPEGFLQKELTTEELALQRARNTAQRDIIAGKYDPYFAVEDRYFANPELYNLQGNTLVDAMPAKQATIDQYAERFDTPQIRDNIRQAYERGLSPTSQNWYAMGQLQDEFIRELGPVEGPKMFKERFADAMAATTGGADPTANLLMSAYVNNRKAQGLSLPTGSTNYPHPIGGRYLAGNMAMADKIIMNETPLTASGQPKRFNFSANFLGDMNRATIDEQMSQLYETGLTAPPGASYGVMERVLGDVGREFGVLPGNVQDVAWAGAKGTQGKPMIQHINEAIERTARVTNKTPREVLVDSIINARSPLYGAAGATIGLSALRNIQRDEEPQRRPD